MFKSLEHAFLLHKKTETIVSVKVEKMGVHIPQNNHFVVTPKIQYKHTQKPINRSDYRVFVFLLCLIQFTLVHV